MTAVRLARTAVCLGFVLALAGCGGDGEPDPLAELTIVPPASGGVLVSLPLRPAEDLSVVDVDIRADAGLDVQYLGYLTRCGELCGVSELPEESEAIERAVEGTVPFQVLADAEPLHLLFSIRTTAVTDRTIRDGDCVTVRDVRLRLDSGERISVRRPDLRFLWVFASDQDPECLRLPVIRSD